MAAFVLSMAMPVLPMTIIIYTVSAHAMTMSVLSIAVSIL